MKLREALERGKDRLQKAGVPDAETDAWYLLEYAADVTRMEYYLHGEKELTKEQEEAYNRCIEKRSLRTPLQHITGEQEFMGLTFSVNPSVLIPRQDTETLVEEVLKVLRPGMELLDLCTGSGCILVSLLKYGKDVTGTGADISPEALETAKENAKRNGVTATFLEGDLFARLTGTYDLIVSNPPYIRTDVIPTLSEEVKGHDPMLALDGKEDGLYFYRRIVAESRSFLKREGRLYFEIGHDQGEAVKNLMENAGFFDVTVKKDLAGLDRVVSGVYNKSDGII